MLNILDIVGQLEAQGIFNTIVVGINALDTKEKKEDRQKEILGVIEDHKKISDPALRKQFVIDTTKTLEGWGLSQEQIDALAENSEDVFTLVQLLILQEKELLKIKDEEEKKKRQSDAENERLFKEWLKTQATVYVGLISALATSRADFFTKSNAVYSTKLDIEEIEDKIALYTRIIASLEKHITEIDKDSKAKIALLVADEKRLTADLAVATTDFEIDKIKRLEAIEFNWDSLSTKWDENYQKLLAFKENYGHARVPNHYSKDKALGFWVSRQRAFYKKNQLDTNKITKLEAIGFEWSIS